MIGDERCLTVNVMAWEDFCLHAMFCKWIGIAFLDLGNHSFHQSIKVLVGNIMLFGNLLRPFSKTIAKMEQDSNGIWTLH